MGKKIFILEDNLYTAEDMYIEISDKLLEHNIKNIEIVIANSIIEANSKLENEKSSDELLCIIADLNMNPKGLTEDQIKRTQGAILTGWVWITSYVWQQEDFKAKKIVFYSAFINRLANSTEYRSLNYTQQKRITLIDKNNYDLDYLSEKILKIIMKVIE